jgi:UDP:flavonoid glycosyltransferase YjiC (YdhE family)
VSIGVAASFVGGWGHAEPLLPIARLATSLGHQVTFLGQRAVLPRLTALGFHTHEVGPDTLSTDRLPLQPVDREAERAVMRDHFIGRYAAVRADALATMFGRERPRLVVCDEVDVGAVVASERLGIPCVTVNVIAAGRLTGPAVVGEAWNRLRAAHGLTADPPFHAFGGALALSPAPRSFRDPAVPTPPQWAPVRPPIVSDAVRTPPPERPFVYATLGTVFNVESGDLLDRLVSGLALVDADVLVTVGPNIDPAEFSGVGGNVRVERFVAQHEVLGRCGAVVSHGGSGTLIAALSLGVPVVVLPMGADQPDNADRCDELGVGLVLDPLDADPPAIARAVDTVLHDRRYARAASLLAAEAAGQPALDSLPALLELL